MDTGKARRLVEQKIDEFQFNLDPDALVGEISVAARQKVEILKLLYRNVSVLILDEPTAVLTRKKSRSCSPNWAACAMMGTPSSSFRTGWTKC